MSRSPEHSEGEATKNPVLSCKNETLRFAQSDNCDLLSLLTNLLYRAGITDEPTGYKVFKTSLLKSIDLKCTGFEFCPEVTAKVRKRSYQIKEVPISYNSRSVREGKKISWRDFILHVFTLFRYRF